MEHLLGRALDILTTLRQTDITPFLIHQTNYKIFDVLHLNELNRLLNKSNKSTT